MSLKEYKTKDYTTENLKSKKSKLRYKVKKNNTLIAWKLYNLWDEIELENLQIKWLDRFLQKL